LIASRTIANTRNEGNERLATPVAIHCTRQVVSGILNAYARDRGKKRWCDKTPNNTSHLGPIELAFPEADYICLYRDCLDVVYSCLEVSRNGFMAELAPYVARSPENLILALMNSWADKTARILEFEHQHKTRCHRIKYESLVAEPAHTLQALFS